MTEDVRNTVQSLREQIEHSARVPTQALERLEKTKFDKPTYGWQFSQDVLDYMERLKQFKIDVVTGNERIVEWPDHVRTAGRVERLVRRLKADILMMWSPVDWETKNR